METYHLLDFKTILDKKYFFLICLTFLCEIVIAQSHKVDSTKIYIGKLNWESFNISTDYIHKPYLLHDAQRIIEIDDNQKIKKLIKVLRTGSKTVTIHMILTGLLEPDSARFKLSYKYAVDKTISEIRYEFNGLPWVFNKELGNKVNQEDINYIRKYWANALKNNRK